MSSITIRNLDDQLKISLRLRAARHGLSMEQEVRDILQSTLAIETSPGSGLDFNWLAVGCYALWRAQRQQAGQPIDTADAQIAAISLAAKLQLVTHNTKDFAHIKGLTVVNPWQLH